jgi:hypothetical protein
MKILAVRKIEQTEVLYKNTEVDKVSELCARDGWVPCSLPTPVHRLILNKVLGKTPAMTPKGLDIVKGWSRIVLQRPLRKRR